VPGYRNVSRQGGVKRRNPPVFGGWLQNSEHVNFKKLPNN
jgi:hypothetical protein